MMLPHCREIVFPDRAEALAAAIQTASVYGGVVAERDQHITASVGDVVLLIARWKGKP
jgi:hypothetical protein